MISTILPKLIGEQCRILYLPENDNQVVLGVAGSGKSVEAAYRAIWMSLGHPDDKILLLTFNKEVNDQLDLMVKSFEHNSNIEVNTIYSYFKEAFNKYYPKDGEFYAWRRAVKGDDFHGQLVATTRNEEKKIFEQLFADAQEKYPDSTLWDKDNAEAFIEDEINWMQQNNITRLEKYKDVERIGRGNERLSQAQRDTMFKIYCAYYNLRKELTGKAFSFQDIYRLFRTYCVMPEADKPKYIIIDEVQDVTPVMFKGLQSIIADDGEWTVFGDLSQNIFGGRISWASLGLNIRKKYSLHRNYRNTKEIGRLAKAMLDTDIFPKDEDTFIEPELSAFSGDLPTLWHLNDDNQDQLIDQIKQMMAEGSTAVILMSPEEKQYITPLLDNADIASVGSIKDLRQDVLFVGSINRIKGLEFDNILVLGIDDIQPGLSDEAKGPDREITDNLNYDDEGIIGKRVYVAATRARKKLIMAYRQNPLSFLMQDASLYKEVD